ncbi:MAG: cell division protein FtsA [Dehalococcoidales bacterium]|nr:cell division protein FtsA [Dehalococcoidales bacterium]
MKRKIAAIDVGTTKVCTIMGTIDSSSGLRILGVGIAPSHGIEKALVANVTQAKESIRQSIKKAEMMAGYRLDSAYIGVTGRHISSMNNRGTIAITKNDQLVRSDDLKRVLDVALNVKAPAERKMLHVIPRAYTLDGCEVKNPVGMHGYELNVEAHVITAAVASVQNLTKCISGVGIEIEDLILEPLASAEAVLSEEEKQAGILIADIGGGTTDIAVVRDGSIYHTSVLPVAGHQITRDISAGLGLSFELAEEMKKRYGTLVPAEEEESDRVVGENGHSVSYRDLCDIIRARVEELMRLVVLELPRTDYNRLIPYGIVITGGGANLPGIVEMTQDITHLPVRIGMPPPVNGVSNNLLNDPAYATSVGLVLWKMKNDNTQKWVNKPSGLRGLLSSIFRLFR